MLAHRDLHLPTDQLMLEGMLERLRAVAKGENPHPDAAAFMKPIDESIDSVSGFFEATRLGDADFVTECLNKTPEQLEAIDDSFLQLIVKLYPSYKRMRETGKAREGRLNQLYGELITAKSNFLKTNFVPDANSTLRITFGRVKGYSPEDAVYKYPITTLKGVVDKTTGVEPFVTPQRILDLHAARDFGRFAHPDLKDIPTAILYSTDTTGGNSGSPILNAKGQLVGVNFDRAFEATINDFAWNESYSRSIGVDVRYVLWITGKVFGADHLLKEMGVE